ncbi:MAG: HAMP domain-containing sensor histidine kinase [Pseudomonadota bacterium]
MALFSGGATSIALGLLIAYPATLAAIKSWEVARPSIVAALAMFMTLLAMSFSGLTPRVPESLSTMIDWVVIALFGLMIAAIVIAQNSRSVATSSEDNSDRADPTPTYNQDVAGLSHDLKSPLTSILGFSQLMRDRTLGPDPALYDTYPDHIHKSALMLQERVHTLLALMQAHDGRLDLERGPVNLATVATSVIERLNPSAEHRRVELVSTIAKDDVVFADEKACERILENLISNAIKYSVEGDRVDISTQQQGHWVCLSVLDRGTGISASDLAKLAQPFEQASHTGLREGTGLGLALVKRLVELQEGEFRIRTASSRGTEMIVKLPYYQSRK